MRPVRRAYLVVDTLEGGFVDTDGERTPGGIEHAVRMTSDEADAVVARHGEFLKIDDPDARSGEEDVLTDPLELAADTASGLLFRFSNGHWSPLFDHRRASNGAVRSAIGAGMLEIHRGDGLVVRVTELGRVKAGRPVFEDGEERGRTRYPTREAPHADPAFDLLRLRVAAVEEAVASLEYATWSTHYRVGFGWGGDG